jgi:hydroxymethylbilane synthase
MPSLVYATRKSQLALAQSRAFVAKLAALEPELEVHELTVTTTGDRIQDRPLADIGGKGLFVKEIEEALLAESADIAVHSSKDVPAELASGLAIGCIPEREDPRDVLVSRNGAPLAELPPGSRVGTTSLRRSLELKRSRPDLEIVPIRGNVDTRLRKCDEGAVDAIVLARAGLVRLGLAARATEVLDPALCLPAAGQGALAIEQRVGDERVAELLARVAHAETTLCVLAERAVLHAVQGGCQTPVAAYAVREGDEIWLRALLAEADGSRPRRGQRRSLWPASKSSAGVSGKSCGSAPSSARRPTPAGRSPAPTSERGRRPRALPAVQKPVVASRPCRSEGSPVWLGSRR